MSLAALDVADSEEKAGLLSGAGGAEDGAAGGKPAGDSAEQGAAVPACACLSVAFYKPYFDVNQGQVIGRALRALWPPAARGFWESLDGRPDMYGPFWAATTLIFVIASLSNFTSWLTFEDAVSLLLSCGSRLSPAGSAARFRCIEGTFRVSPNFDLRRARRNGCMT